MRLFWNLGEHAWLSPGGDHHQHSDGELQGHCWVFRKLLSKDAISVSKTFKVCSKRWKFCLLFLSLEPNSSLPRTEFQFTDKHRLSVSIIILFLMYAGCTGFYFGVLSLCFLCTCHNGF